MCVFLFSTFIRVHFFSFSFFCGFSCVACKYKLVVTDGLGCFSCQSVIQVLCRGITQVVSFASRSTGLVRLDGQV